MMDQRVDKLSTLAALFAGVLATLDIWDKVLFADSAPILPSQWWTHLVALSTALLVGYLTAGLVQAALRKKRFGQAVRDVGRLIGDMIRPAGWAGIALAVLLLALLVGLVNG